MKKILFFLLVIIASCTTDSDFKTQTNSEESATEKNDNARIMIDPGCHGGEWFQNSNLSTVSPLNYNEWMTINVLAYIPLAWNDVKGVQVKYRLQCVSGPPVYVAYMGIYPTAKVTTYGATLYPGQYVDVTYVVPSCEPVYQTLPPPSTHNIQQWGFQVKFIKVGSGTTGSVSGQIQSVTNLNCTPVDSPYCLEHKKATFEQGWFSSIN